MLTKKEQKVATFYECIFCDYKTSKKFNYQKHLSTQKHKNRENAKNANKKEQKVANYECLCGKTYKFQSSLSKHKSICKSSIENQIFAIVQENINYTHNTDGENIEKKNLTMRYTT